MNERNFSIDVLKFICAVLVIFLHTNSNFQEITLPFTRCAVPCFFIISGYLLFNKKNISQDRLNRNLTHVAKISLWSTSFFIVWTEFKNFVEYGTLFIPSYIDIIEWVVFNNNPFAFHLWYLFAYLYVLLIISLINKYEKWKLLYWLTPVLLLGDLGLGKYSLLIWGYEPNFLFVRNFLFVGLPYFTLGCMIKRFVDHSLIFNNKYLLLAGIILFTLTTYGEKFFLTSVDMSTTRDHYLSSTFLAICIFLLAQSINMKKRNIISILGEKYSLFIYIFHPVFISCCNVIFKIIGLHQLYLYISPIVVLVTTYFFVFCLKKMRILN